MKKLSILTLILIGHIYQADAHWSDSYNGDNEGIGLTATIIVIIVLIALTVSDEIDKKK